MLNPATHLYLFFFFFNDPATTEIYTLPLHDALPICRCPRSMDSRAGPRRGGGRQPPPRPRSRTPHSRTCGLHRSEEHTSELQSQSNLVCRLLLEKKKTNHTEIQLPYSQHRTL